MAFNIVLQINSSDRIKLDKSITDIITLSGVLKQETSIIDPIITIEGDISSFVNCNYMTIPIFGRAYFVNDIRSIRHNLFEVSGHVDVLTSYKSQIRENNAIVRKQENNWNLYLNDGSFRVYHNPNVIAKNFPSGFSSPELVLAVAGS